MEHSDIEAFVRAMRSYSPALSVAASRQPLAAAGRHWIDIHASERFSAVSWQEGEGFGFYDEDAPGFGDETPLEIIRDPRQAAAHAADVLVARGWPLERRPIHAGIR